MSILNNQCVRVVIPGIVFLLGLAPNAAFRGTYMARLRTVLTVADAAYLKSRDKRHGRSLASQMSPEVPGRSRSWEPTHYSQPSTSRRLSPASASVVVVTSESSTPAVVRPHRYGRRAASFPLDLLLPRFAAPELRTGPCQTRWVHEYDSPASPAALTSLWLNLYTLSSDGSLLTPFVSLMCRLNPGIRKYLVTMHHRVFTLTETPVRRESTTGYDRLRPPYD